jgi:hypothetical protein
MSEVESETAKMVYRKDDIYYDVSKLNTEAQQAFMMLAEIENKVLRETEVALATVRAAQSHYNNLIQNNLSDEAKMAEPGPLIIDGESQEDS